VAVPVVGGLEVVEVDHDQGGGAARWATNHSSTAQTWR
jgi:hypothetical protein